MSQWLVFNIWSYINSFSFILFSPYFHIYYKTITFLKEKNLKQLTDLHAKPKTVAARQHFLNSFFGTNMNPFILGWCTTFLHLFLLREKESCHLKCFNVKKNTEVFKNVEYHLDLQLADFSPKFKRKILKKSSVNNYRSINLLSNISKVYGRYIYNQIPPLFKYLL